MTFEIIMISIVGGGVVITGLGVIRLWIKNGRELSKRDGALEANLKGIFIGQTEIKQEISNIKEDLGHQAVHCAGVVSGFAERIENLEKKD